MIKKTGFLRPRGKITREEIHRSFELPVAFLKRASPIASRSTFGFVNHEAQNAFVFFFLLPLLPFSHFFIYFLRIDERNLFDRNIVYIDKWNEIDTTRLYQEVDNTFIHLLYTYFFLYLYYFIDRDF